VHGPTKVSDLELAVDAEEEVLRLDISMDNVLPMQIRQSVGHLSAVLQDRRMQRKRPRG
jgi:hypothetical protein